MTPTIATLDSAAGFIPSMTRQQTIARFEALRELVTATVITTAVELDAHCIVNGFEYAELDAAVAFYGV